MTTPIVKSTIPKLPDESGIIMTKKKIRKNAVGSGSGSAVTLATSYTESDIGCHKYEVGVDEAGRGPLFGRVYTSAVILPPANSIAGAVFNFSLLKDSKKFSSDKKIREVADYIKEHAFGWSISYEEADVIDHINIRRATLQCMRKSIKSVIDRHIMILKQQEQTIPPPTYRDYLLLIDGNDFIPMGSYNEDTEEMETYTHVCVEGGDNTYACIAAASILAKVARDDYIEKLCDQYPVLDEMYSLRGNKGYGAKKHLDGIREHGITQWHRRSYGICKEFS